MFKPALLALEIVLIFSGSLAQQKPKISPPIKKPNEVMKKEPMAPTTTGDKESTAPTDNAKEKTLTANQQRAYNLLQDIAADSKDITDPSKRIKTQTRIADSFWALDTLKAKELFKEAFLAIGSLEISTTAPDAKTANAKTIKAIKDKLRREALQIIGRRDLAFADELAKSVPTETVTEKLTVDAGSFAQNSAIEMRLQMAASVIGSSDDKSEIEQAASLVRDTLRLGISRAVMPTLFAIRRKLPQLGSQIFLEIIAIVSANPTYYNYEMVGFLGIFVIDTGHSNGQASPEAVKKYLQYAYKVITYQIELEQRTGSGQLTKVDETYSMLYNLLPLYRQYLPEEAGLVYGQMQKLSASVSTRTIAAEINKKDSMAVNDLIEKAENARTPVEKERFLTTAATLAARQGETDLALSTAGKLSIPEDRQFILSIVRTIAFHRELERNEPEAAYKFAKDMEIPEHRWESFNSLIKYAMSKKDAQSAKEFLAEIGSYLEKNCDTEAERASGYFSVAETALTVDAVDAVAVIKAAVKSFNRADFAEPIKRKSKHRVEPAEDRTPVESVFSGLGKYDFEEALLQARSIEKKDFSVLAQIAVCRSLLNESNIKKRP
jgi:hypothetical protein